MKLQFKEQDFQLQAVDAVVKCLEGQPIKTNRFTLERTRDIIRKTREHFEAKTFFTKDQNVLRTNEILKKHIYDFLKTDSPVEKEFAKNLEEAVEVVVYAKLPKNFYVSTPIANYSPDWAIVLDEKKVKHIYFVAKTKGSDDRNDLRSLEQLKIYCARDHFKTIANGDIKFDVITNYQKLLELAKVI